MAKDTPKTKVKLKDVFREYIREALRFPWLIGGVFAAAITSQVTSLISPIYMRTLFNTLASGTPTPSTVSQLWSLVIVIASISLAGWVASRVQTYCLIYLEAHAMGDLYKRSFDYLMRHSYQFFISRFTGTITRRVTRFAASFETIIDSVMLNFFPTVLFAAGAVGVLFVRNHILGIALAIWVIIFIAFQLFVARLRQPLRVARADADSKVSGTLSDAVTNQNTVALFSGTAFESSFFASIVDLWRKATTRSWNADEYIWSIQGFLIVVINIGLLYGAVIYWQKGELTIGDFVLIQSYLMGLFGQLMGISWTVRRFYDAYADAVEMVEILDTPHEVKDIVSAPALAVTEGKIAFNAVEFFFQPDRPVLNNFGLVIPGHQKLAIVGPSGAGKTTITKLLLRLYDLKKGAIEIDGQDIARVTQDSLREAIAFVPQEPILFHRTLMENIQYGNRAATKEQVIEAAKKAHCHDFISVLPDGYDTFVGERGVKLSGGERQRVAIARAILKNAPILLLDEATSSLDSESEALIQDALDTLMKGKTVIVIAHRLSTIMRMDRIVVVENGGIVADGTHQDLLEQKGLYNKLWSIQAGGFRNDLAEKGEA